jgi:uncharacterized protein (DUF2336 family)
MNPQTQTLLSELDTTLTKASGSRHLLMLRQLTDLFVAGAPSYSPEQVAVFEAVFKRLTQDMESRALVEFSGRLAGFDSAPADIINRLSSADDIAVAAPVLEKSNLLTDAALVGIAKNKGLGHLLAIASRARINEPVTDVLVERGNAEVKHKVVVNPGALLSEGGFARLISDARADKKFAALVAQRQDIPPELKPFLDMALAR